MARDQRRLAAIVSADVVGYSLLMGRDDSATLAGLKAHRRELIDPKIAEYGGRIVKTTGDGLLLDFPSVVDAVRCAVDVQRGVGERNTGVPPELRIEFRIGINVGDIIIDGDDIFGDGVNVAARLQTLAEPGGICVSRVVRDHVVNKLSIAFQALGAHDLKNIVQPVEVYRLDTGTTAARKWTTAAPAPVFPQPTLAAAGDNLPSIAVLPFVNLSGDPANEYFADGLAEELLNVLSKIRGLRVVSRTSSFYFKGKDVDLATVARKLNVATILEGSVRTSKTRVRIAVQLIQVSTDSHIWSNTYDRELDDIFALQDEIAQSIVVELRLGLGRPTTGRNASGYEVAEEIADASRGRTLNREALQFFLQGRFFARRQTRDDLARALGYYERALALDPNFAWAWAGAGSAHAALAGYGGNVSVADGFRRARAATQRALDLEPNLAAAHSILSWIKLYCDWDWKGADASSRRALELAPNDAGVLRNAAIVAGNLGQDENAVALILRASALDPLDASGHRTIAMMELDAMHLDAAEAALTRALDVDPRLALTHFTRGLICLARGQAIEGLVSFQRETLEDYRLLGVSLAQRAQGLHMESFATLSELIEKYATLSPCQIAAAYACRGEPNLAFEWLDRAFLSRDPRLVEIKTESLLTNLRRDSRWRPFLQKMGFAE